MRRITQSKTGRHCVIPQENVENKILFIRGKKVILDKDIALLYGVKAIALRQQVRRNLARFPGDFMFQLTKIEVNSLVSQNVIPSLRSLGGFPPLAFTEHGVAMLSGVLNSERAVYVNIQIMRAFVQLRQILETHKDLRQKIEGLERKYDHQFAVVFRAIKRLMDPPVKQKEPIGFQPPSRPNQSDTQKNFLKRR